MNHHDVPNARNDIENTIYRMKDKSSDVMSLEHYAAFEYKQGNDKIKYGNEAIVFNK